MRATSVKQHRRQPVRPALRHDQVGAGMVVAADPAEDPTATNGPSMGPVGVAGKPALVKINHMGFAVLGDPITQPAQERYSFFVTTFSVARRFF